MTRTVASLTAAAVLYAFTSALAQMLDPEPAPTASAPQVTTPDVVPAPSMEVLKSEGGKEKHGQLKKEHWEKGKSAGHRKDGDHKVRAKHKDREKHSAKQKAGDRHEKN